MAPSAVCRSPSAPVTSSGASLGVLAVGLAGDGPWSARFATGTRLGTVTA